MGASSLGRVLLWLSAIGVVAWQDPTTVVARIGDPAHTLTPGTHVITIRYAIAGRELRAASEGFHRHLATTAADTPSGVADRPPFAAFIPFALEPA